MRGPWATKRSSLLRRCAVRTVKSLVAVLLLLPFTALSAQEQLQFEPGTRLRLTAPAVNLQRLVTTVVSADPETLVVLSSDQSLQVPFASITKLEVARQRGDLDRVGAGGMIGFVAGAGAGVLFVHLTELEWYSGVPFALGGALIGTTLGYGGAPAARGMGLCFLIGAGVGAGLGLLVNTDPPEDMPSIQAPAMLAGFGGALGLIVGPVIGIVTSKWREVSLGRARLTLVPQRVGELAVGVSVRL